MTTARRSMKYTANQNQHIIPTAKHKYKSTDNFWQIKCKKKKVFHFQLGFLKRFGTNAKVLSLKYIQSVSGIDRIIAFPWPHYLPGPHKNFSVSALLYLNLSERGRPVSISLARRPSLLSGPAPPYVALMIALIH